MKGYNEAYMEVTGLDPLEDQIKTNLGGIKYAEETIYVLTKVQTFFRMTPEGRDILLDDDIQSMCVSSYSGLTIHLAEKDSKLPHRLVQFLGGLRLDKKNNGLDSGFTLTTQIPEDHLFRVVTGVERVSIYGYLPQTCKLVEFREPISEERRLALEDELMNGTVRFRTECKPEGEEAQVEVIEPESVEVPF